MDKITKYLDNIGLIKVLVWQRRVGKSYIMKQVIDFLKTSKGVKDENIIYINLEIDYLKYSSIKELDEFIQAKIKKAKWRIYLFIDEVQEIIEWERLLNSYRANDDLDIDIFITWSNANLLSSEFATLLAGRYIDFEIFPFSYEEYLWYFNLENNKSNFLEYLNFSGISELYKLEDLESKVNFLRAVRDSIILRDIVKRHNIKDVDLLEKLFLFLSGNIWNLFSLNSIVKKLKSVLIKSNTNTIWNYVNFLEKTFTIHGVLRYDLKWKKILEWEKKYYLNDLAFNNFFVSNYDIWGGGKLENLVYNYLRRNWYKVFVGNIWDLEIDFVAEKWKKIVYIQVAYLISDEEVFKREFWNLESVRDNYEKIVVSLDDVLIDYKGIKHIQAWELDKYL